MARKRQKPEFGIVREWTPEGKDFTHWAIIRHDPDPAEKIGCIVVEHKTKEEAKLGASNALKEKRYGEIHTYVSDGMGHIFGYAVHYPRFESEGDGFLNFHLVKRFFLVEN